MRMDQRAEQINLAEIKENKVKTPSKLNCKATTKSDDSMKFEKIENLLDNIGNSKWSLFVYTLCSYSEYKLLSSLCFHDDLR